MMGKSKAVLFFTPLLAGAAVCSCADDDYSSRPPQIYFASGGSYTIGPSDTLTLSPRVLYDFGSSYGWTAGGEVLGTTAELVFVPQAMRDYDLLFSVRNANGTDTAHVGVRVALVADFENVENVGTVKSNTLTLYPDTLGGAFRWSGLSFANAVNADSSSWGGFALSCKNEIVNTISSSAVGTVYVATDNSSSKNKFMSVYAAADIAEVDFGGNAYSPVSIDLANDNLVFLASKFGYLTADSATVGPADKDDYFRVVVWGLGDNGLPDGSMTTFDLIDCAYDNPAKYVRRNKWTTVALSGMGRVCGLRLTVETSIEGIPPLFCADNLILQE